MPQVEGFWMARDGRQLEMCFCVGHVLEAHMG